MRLLVFNLATDADDPLLGFTTTWLEALAARVDRVEVITMRAGALRLPTNVRVRSLGKEHRYSEPRRLLRFYRLLLDVLAGGRVDACFSHMTPIFTVLGAPLLRAAGVPIVTWYAHRNVDWAVRVGHHLSQRVVASVPDAYRYRHDRLVVLGQGVDTRAFTPGDAPDDPPLLLSLGRLSPIKDLGTLVEAVALLRRDGADVRCALVGDAPVRDSAYAAALRDQVATLGLADVVALPGPAIGPVVADWYRRATAHVNLAPTGAIDKAALEAMACGRPSLAANEAFRPVLGRHAEGLLFRHGDAADLAARLRALLAATPAERAAIGKELRQAVVAEHSLDRLADRLVDLLADVAATVRGRSFRGATPGGAASPRPGPAPRPSGRESAP